MLTLDPMFDPIAPALHKQRCAAGTAAPSFESSVHCIGSKPDSSCTV